MKRFEYLLARPILLMLLAACTVCRLYTAGGTKASDREPTLGMSLIMTPGREFASTSYVHLPLPTTVEIDPLSDIWVRDLQRQIKQYYGVASVNITEYAPTFYHVGPNQPTRR